MKNNNLFLICSFVILSQMGVGSVATAADIHIKDGELLKVDVEGCKTSQYGVALSTKKQKWEDSDSFVARCLPKICLWGGSSGGNKVLLYPDDKIVGTFNSSRELDALLKKLVDDGVCDHTERRFDNL